MKPYEHINWEYTQEESLEIDKEKLSEAELKLTRDLNSMAREFYEKEKIELEQKIKDRTDLILNYRKESLLNRRRIRNKK